VRRSPVKWSANAKSFRNAGIRFIDSFIHSCIYLFVYSENFSREFVFNKTQ
jgi:hypothetical protein